MKLLLKIMYDGTEYSGYQAQRGSRTVQSMLTECISECFGMRMNVTGCSRTDAGVHATGFCAAVEPYAELNRGDGWLKIPVGRVHRALFEYLPDDISVCGEAQVGDDFHPRYCAVSKSYIYKMYDSPYSDPFLKNRAWHLNRSLTDSGIELMNEAAGHIIGKHDFTSFMTTGSKITDAKRTVYSLDVMRHGGIVEFHISADGFLYNMVRIIAGTLVDCTQAVYKPDDIEKIIKARDRSAAGRTAPACGLYLNEVRYDREINWTIL